MTPETQALVRSATASAAVPFVPEVTLRTAAEPFGLWDRTERDAPPFWAFPWAGGQGLARYVLDHPAEVAGRFVLDFGAGSGLVAIAAAKAGAAGVLAAEIDHFAAAAIAINATLNKVAVTVTTADVIDTTDSRWEVVAAGDVCYEQPMATRVARWLAALARRGSLVLLGDPGRAYLPANCLRERARYLVPTSRELEDRDTRDGVVWEVLPS